MEKDNLEQVIKSEPIEPQSYFGTYKWKSQNKHENYRIEDFIPIIGPILCSYRNRKIKKQNPKEKHKDIGYVIYHTATTLYLLNKLNAISFNF